MAGEGRATTGAELMEPALPLLPAVEEPVPTRKPRGRPMGSRNKPKPPVFVTVTRDGEAAMRPVVLELSPGSDVVASLAAFARRRGVGVSVLCARGAVAAVTLRLAPTVAASPAVTLHGRFELLALSGTVLPPSAMAAAGDPGWPAFSVSLAGAGGQVIGGTLAGEITAADGVVLVAAVFRTAEVHRLPVGGTGGGKEEDGDGGDVAAGVGGFAGGDDAGSGGGGGGLVGQQHFSEMPEMGLWGQEQTPTQARGLVNDLPRF